MFVPSLQQRGFEGLVNPIRKPTQTHRLGLGTKTYEKHEGTKWVACCYDVLLLMAGRISFGSQERTTTMPTNTHTSSDSSSSSSSSSTAWPPYLESGTPFLFLKFVSKMSWVLFISQRACRMQGGGSSVWASSKSTHKSHPFTYLGLYKCLSISI